MHKIEKIDSIFHNNGKPSSVKSFDFIAPIEKKKDLTPLTSAPAGVLTFSFNTISFIELMLRQLTSSEPENPGWEVIEHQTEL